MKKNSFGCLWYIIMTIGMAIGLTGIFWKIAPETAQRARIEIIERVFGVSIDKSKSESKDSIVVIPKAEPIKSDTVPYITIPIEVKDNTTYIVANVNGVDVRFILDTGCTDMQLTVVEFEFLRHNGLASEDDLGPQVKCSYANGDEGLCHTFKVKTFKIGGIDIGDVHCTIDENTDAPRLLGQTVLQKLGEVTIDYNEKVIKVKNK